MGKSDHDMSGNHEGERQGIQSIETGFRILDVLSAAHGPMNLSSLAAAADMSSSGAHRYLVSLIKCGIVRQDPATNRYDLGEAALHLGLRALSRLNVVQRATEACIQLNQELDVTTLLSIWGARGPVVVGWYDSSEIMICNANVGSIFPVLSTASGRTFLAFLPPAVTRPFVDRELRSGLVAKAPRSKLKTMADVEKLIDKIRKKRVATTQEEFVPGLSASATPVFDHQGRVVASMAIIGVRGSVEALGPGTLAESLREAGNEVSRTLGFRDHGLTFVEWLEQHKDAATDEAPSLLPPAVR